MRRIFGEYGLFIVVAIIVSVILGFAISSQNNGFLGADGIGGMRPGQTTQSKNNSDTLTSLYEHKDPTLVITPVTLKVGSSYDFYTDFLTTACEYASDGSVIDISDRLTIQEMTYLLRTDLSDPDAQRTSIDLSGIDLSSYTISSKGIYEVTYKLTDHQGFETVGTYQFPAD